MDVRTEVDPELDQIKQDVAPDAVLDKIEQERGRRARARR
jgi:hypothetical protein